MVPFAAAGQRLRVERVALAIAYRGACRAAPRGPANSRSSFMLRRLERYITSKASPSNGHGADQSVQRVVLPSMRAIRCFGAPSWRA